MNFVNFDIFDQKPEQFFFAIGKLLDKFESPEGQLIFLFGVWCSDLGRASGGARGAQVMRTR